MKFELTREFIYVDEFDRSAQKHGFTSRDYFHIEQLLLSDPKKGTVLQFANGLRKLRYAPIHLKSGKSGGFRIFYVDIESYNIVVMITLINKREADNLTDEELRYLGKFVVQLKQLYMNKEW
ncbi:addiction module toxin RelE [Listeria booriae]|uniref:addiction module toxin RelE n=1 Tax=Listeria booriae TaxID=1552123 RepID=UPI00162A1CC3|nr:addiction module toxin RelE [Listeria booriae]MBC1976426.1 addiction module toxin RelE [Listeria booriae]MBC2034131.1 addiction module toxin RelE [Listeria booriae]MBC2208309.1 addiction module toxin RelE [Listeria booriae]